MPTAVATAEIEAPTRIDIQSQPAGAVVAVDGTDRGTTPITLFDLKPGRHHVRFRMAGYEDRDRFYTLEMNRPMQQSVVLTPVKGLLLLQSEPDGANITIDGVSVGITPRLVTTLDVKEVHHVSLDKAGYRASEFDVKFDGRRPVVRRESLLLDAGIIEISTDPAGASVMVNGIDRGLSPVTVRDVPKGLTTVKVSKEGFDSETREIRVNAGDQLKLSVAMKGLPGTLQLTSLPDGARFYVNNEFSGVSPVTLKDLRPGSYTVRTELKGYGTDTRVVEIGNGETPRIEVRLSNVMGRIEVVTIPVGIQVSLDGHPAGMTSSTNPEAQKSDPLPIENVLEGEHVLTLKGDGYVTVVKHPNVVNSKTETVAVKMKRFFKPDVILHTNTGEVSGRLIKNGPEYIEIEISLGVTKSLPRSNIRKLEFIEE